MKFLFPLLLMGTCMIASAQDYTFRLKNTLGIQRTSETVEVAVPEGTDLTKAALCDEAGTAIPYETVGTDAIRFQATVAPCSTTGYTLREGTPLIPTKVTYAAVKVPQSRADIAWENDLCAYRMYSSVLLQSEPNTAQGVDVWFKKKVTPVIDDMFNLSNYHNESQYGVDAYSVNGKRLGCGGTAAVVNGHLQMHGPYATCTIGEQSALRSSFTLTYDNVNIEGNNYTKTLTVEATAGALLNKGTMRLDGPAATLRLAVAIYQHTDMNLLNEGVAFTELPGVIGWAEAKSEGSVTSAGARFFQGAYIPQNLKTSGPLNIKTEVIDNHLCLVVDYTVGSELTFYFGAGWNIFPEGRYDSDEAWFEALSEFKQAAEAPLTLTSMQTLPMKDDVLAILNTVNQTWQEKHPTHGDYFWNRAVYHIGNMAAYDVTGDAEYLDYSTAWANKSNWWGATGTDKSKWKYTPYGEGADFVLFGDNQVCFQVYADLYNLDPAHDPKKIERALEVMGYEISTDNDQYLWWVDGLFMVMPIMTKLYNITGDQTYLDKMYAYWQYANSIMYDEETGLYFRDAKYVYPVHQTNAGKKDFWARGDGWIFAAFAKALNELPETDSHREEYISYYRRMAAALKACQQDEGYWTRSLLDPAQAPGYETSGTALNTFAYAWGIRSGILSEEEYGHTLERAWNYLATIALQTDGTVGYIQPIGENASPNTTVKVTDYHDFGVGAYLLATSEMSRLAVGDMELPKLRLTGVAFGEANEIIVNFNLKPNVEEALDAGHYTLDGQPLELYHLELTGEKTVTLTLASPLDYGRYTFGVHDIHSADGGVMADNQQRTMLRTVPLTVAQTGVTLTAIGSQSGNPHGNVNDNNLSTRWSQQGTSGQWLQFDLRSLQTVEAVDIAFYNGDARVAYFDLQTSEDGKTFTPVAVGLQSSGLTNELERYHITPTEARYVRIVCNGTSAGDWNSITEARVRIVDYTLSEVTMPAVVWSDVLLPATTPAGNVITWISSNKQILSGTGIVTLSDADRDVTLTAVVGSSTQQFPVTVKARDIQANLLAHYAFEDADVYRDNTQTFLKDHSTHGRDAELKNTATVKDGQLDLTANTATGFTTNGYVLMPSDLLDSLRSYTVMFVATPTHLDKQPRFYDFGSSSGNSVFLRGNTLAAGLKYNNGTTALVNASRQMETGRQQQVAVTFEASTRTTRVYLDGECVAENTNITYEPYHLTTIANDTRNYIGRTQWWSTSAKNDNQDYCGLMDDFRVYGLALTPEELEVVFSNKPTNIASRTIVREQSGIYNLQGMRMATDWQHLPAGIYIVNGRKTTKH